MWIKRLFVFWQVTGQVGQRVRLATRALSASVSAAIRCYLPRWEVRAQAIGVIDRWFDTLNTRVPHADKLERSSYGSSAEIKAAQDAALGAMDTLVRSARKATAKQLLGRTMPLPFQQGILRSSASLRGLYAELLPADAARGPLPDDCSPE